MRPAPAPPLPWLFSARTDLVTFLGSATLALLLLCLGQWLGWADRDTPEWLWIATIVLIDVAHVYATGFRVYLDRRELRRRAWLYAVVPVLAFAIAAAVYSEGPLIFWRTLAYLAVFHFVRQQYGWVMLYRARAGEHGFSGRLTDSAAIYLATIYPLVFWHAHPRRFAWFVDTDFATLPVAAEQLLWPVYCLSLILYVSRSVAQAVWHHRFNPGKDIVVITTVICWYAGIVACNSDYAFTVTNVITHGVPYIVLVGWYREHPLPAASGGPWPAGRWRQSRWPRVLTFVGGLWALAFFEELLWDRSVWHERSWLFGRAWDIGNLDLVLIPLLAVPQITHYILDGFIWRRRSNPEVAERSQSAQSLQNTDAVDDARTTHIADTCQ